MYSYLIYILSKNKTIKLINTVKIIQFKLERKLLSGNAAIGRGAIEADVRIVTGYPGTPSTDILESIKDDEIYKEWSTNEKVAFEVALGASIMGVRAMTIMKNAGVNWIMDPLAATCYTGIKGGLVIVVADDPGAHFSVTEQDTRGIAQFLKIPCLEPSNSQECKEMTKKAFEISEELGLPVIIRTVTKVAHTVSNVELNEKNKLNYEIKFNKHYKKPYHWNPYAPLRPVSDHELLLNTIPKQKKISEESKFNKLLLNKGSIGIITSGIAYSYVSEAIPNANILKIGLPNPIPTKLVLDLIINSEKVFVIEDGDSIIENQVKQITNKEIFSRRKKYGELNVNEVKNSILL